jgi:hypothetical protein
MEVCLILINIQIKKNIQDNLYLFVVKTESYVYLIPYVEEDEYYFLKTVIPNREAKKKYMEDKNG